MKRRKCTPIISIRGVLISVVMQCLSVDSLGWLQQSSLAACMAGRLRRPTNVVHRRTQLGPRRQEAPLGLSSYCRPRLSV